MAHATRSRPAGPAPGCVLNAIDVICNSQPLHCVVLLVVSVAIVDSVAPWLQFLGAATVGVLVGLPYAFRARALSAEGEPLSLDRVLHAPGDPLPLSMLFAQLCCFCLIARAGFLIVRGPPPTPPPVVSERPPTQAELERGRLRELLKGDRFETRLAAAEQHVGPQGHNDLLEPVFLEAVRYEPARAVGLVERGLPLTPAVFEALDGLFETCADPLQDRLIALFRAQREQQRSTAFAILAKRPDRLMRQLRSECNTPDNSRAVEVDLVLLGPAVALRLLDWLTPGTPDHVKATATRALVRMGPDVRPLLEPHRTRPGVAPVLRLIKR